MAERSKPMLNMTKPLLETDWASLARKLNPPIDERLLFSAFQSTINCWLSFALFLRLEKSALKLSFGKNRKSSKIPIALQFRFFTHAELESIYFLVLTDLFAFDDYDRLTRFHDYIKATKLLGLKGDLRAVFMNLGQIFADEGRSAIQKSNQRTRNFLLKNGFSHIRLDFITGQIRLCPITKDFDKSASLYMSQQPQKDVVPAELEQLWIETFGPGDRGFYEIALDARVNAFHEKIAETKKHLTIRNMVSPDAPKHGITVLPLISGLIGEEGFASILLGKS